MKREKEKSQKAKEKKKRKSFLAFCFAQRLFAIHLDNPNATSVFQPKTLRTKKRATTTFIRSPTTSDRTFSMDISN